MQTHEGDLQRCIVVLTSLETGFSGATQSLVLAATVHCLDSSLLTQAAVGCHDIPESMMQTAVHLSAL